MSKKKNDMTSTPLLNDDSGASEYEETEIDDCYNVRGSGAPFEFVDVLTQPLPPSSNNSNGRVRTQSLAKSSWLIHRMVFFSIIGGFLFGYDTGVVSGVMVILRRLWHLSTVWQEIIVSATIAAAALFSPIGGFCNDALGRRFTILIASFVFTSGSIILGAATNLSMLLIGRITVGIAIGLSSTTIPMYIAESAPCNIRGRLITLYNLSVTFGQCVAGISDGALSYVRVDGWRYMLGLAAVPAAVQFVGFLFMPESPRYLVIKNRDLEARDVLEKIRGAADVDDELSAIRASIEDDQRAQQGDSGTSGFTLWRILKTPAVRRALVVGCGLQLFQQICGINTVMYYSATIIKMSGVQDLSIVIWLAALTATANFVFSFVGLFLVDRIGRRPLTLASLTGVLVSLIVLAVSFQLMAANSPAVSLLEQSSDNTSCSTYSSCYACTQDTDCGFCYTSSARSPPTNGSCVAAYTDDYGYSNMSTHGRCEDDTPGHSWTYKFCPSSVGWLATFGLVLYLACFSPGMGPMPWTINAEIYPTWARSTGNATATMVNWLANLVVAMTFLSLTEALTTYGAFWLYSGFTVIGIIFLSSVLPETKGKTLEEVETLFQKPFCS